jgi:DNA-binding NtrC family response regulator
MLEVVLDACGLFLDAAEAADCGSGEGFGCHCGGCGRDAVLEVGVEELVRVQLGRVTGQMEGLDLFTISTATSRSTSGRRHRRGPEGAALPHEDVSDDDSEHERKMIVSALTQSRGRISGPRGAAATLGLPPSTLEARIKKLNIRKNRFQLG